MLGPPDEERPSLVDPDASDEARALYYNLHRLSAEATLFGHHDEWTRRITYVSVWRNAPHTQIEGHFYAPYPGQKSADDFVDFYEHPFIRFENELPDLYDLP